MKFSKRKTNEIQQFKKDFQKIIQQFTNFYSKATNLQHCK